MKEIFVTEPFLPELEEYIPYLKKIWNNKQLTNNGPLHKELENKLTDFLGVKYVSLFCNATIALLVAIKALKLKGEIITTPYSFVATSHVIKWNGVTPIFVDIENDNCNLDPSKIEENITNDTTAILPVHVYGTPCNDKAIKKIAKKYNLKVIYDAAHAFHVKENGQSILNYGDLSVLSFHATKVFNTFEGGAIISHSAKMKKKIDDLKNFGFQNQFNVQGLGINGKMNELQAAMGLLQLNTIVANIKKRKLIAKKYYDKFKNISGLSMIKEKENIDYNYAYFPIFINEKKYGISCSKLYDNLKSNNIYARRYFYPLISSFSEYKNLPSSKGLDISKKLSDNVICLPIYPSLKNNELNFIINLIKKYNVR